SLRGLLDELRANGEALPEATALEYARNLAEALAALHGEHRLAHRDLKPQNVLLRLAPHRASSVADDWLVGSHAVLADLGVAVRLDAAPTSVVLLGQDGYKAPELYDPAR